MFLGIFLTGLVGFGLLVSIIDLPVRFLILLGQRKSLERELKALTDRTSADPAQPAIPALPTMQGDVAASLAHDPSAYPSPMPPNGMSSGALNPFQREGSERPSCGRLRYLGLLPPLGLRGEYALGAW